MSERIEACMNEEAGEWFEKSFGTDYLVVYRHRDWAQAAKEVQQMIAWLDLGPHASVLDVGCGMGRHALALAELGYDMTGVDLSQALLAEARRHDQQACVRWLQGDMRQLPVADESFDATINVFTSFGYFSEETDNNRVLHELRRVLKPGGKFLIDYLNPTWVVRTLVPFSSRLDEMTGLTIEEQRSADDRWVRKTIEVRTREGQSRHYREQVRLFDLGWFETALAEAGLVLEGVRGGYEGEAYEPAQARRMILFGRAAG